jgi:hypothetical protein
MHQISLDEKLKTGAEASLVRLFRRFRDADYAASAWEACIKRARDGADQPFAPLKYDGPIEQHSVCQQVLSTIGSGKTGTQVRKELEASPFGWPRDAIDAGLIALHRSQHLTATLNGVPVVAGQLDQNKIPKTEFRVEKTTLSVGERLAIRKLYQVMSIPCKAGEEIIKAPDFTRALLTLAAEAGGAPPLPGVPPIQDIEDIQKLVGNTQLVALKDNAAGLEARVADWKKTKLAIAQRLPLWQTVERLGLHAQGLPDAAAALAQVEAVRTDRLLMDPADPATPLRPTLANTLRQAVNAAQQAHDDAYAAGVAALEANENWKTLAAADQTRILGDVGLVAPSKPDLSTDAALVTALDARNLAARRAEADAVAGRVDTALKQAAQLLEPKVQFVALEKATLHTEAEVRQWSARQEAALLAALKSGPVQVA